MSEIVQFPEGGRLGEPSLPGALPLAGGEQGTLGLPEIADGIFLPHAPVAPRYTAARFRAERTEDYHAAVRMIGEGRSAADICRTLNIHHRTLAAVAEIEAVAVGEVKARTIRGFRTALAVAADKAPEEMAKLDGVKMFIAAGITADKLAQLEGEPTQRIEVTVRDARVDWERLRAGPVIELDGADARPCSKPVPGASCLVDGAGGLPTEETKNKEPGTKNSE